MRIDVQQLGAKVFKLDLDGDGERVVELAPASSIIGYYESTDEETRLRLASSDTLTVPTWDWPIGSSRLSLGSAARLDNVQVGLTFPKTKKRKRVGWAGGVAIGRLSMGGVEVSAPSLPSPIQIEGLQLEDAALVRDKGQLRVEVARASIKRLTVSLHGKQIIADDVELPKGFRYDENGLSVDELSLGELRLVVDDLSAKSSDKKSKRKREDGVPMDWRVLDHLNGKLDVDLTADATVPIIGRRKATHHFRIPIDEGTVDYKAMEHSLSALEDSVLDFKVRDNRLLLVVNVPLLPLDATTLVSWMLERDELVMAKRKRVRLRRLLDYQLREPKKEKKKKASDKKASFALRALHFDRLVFEISVRGPVELPLGGGIVKLGEHTQPAVAALRVRGDVHYDASGTSMPTELKLDVESFHGGLADLAVGSGKLNAGAIHVAAVPDFTIGFEGVRPGKLAGTFRGVEVRELQLTFA
jgi:hypothetical protein